MIEAILFDKDGTLFDFQRSWAAAFSSFLTEIAPGPLRAPTAEALGFDEACGRFTPDSIVIASTTGEIARALAPIVKRAPSEIIATLDHFGRNAPQVPAVPLDACLSGLKSRYTLGLVTNDSEAPARLHLEGAGILHHFDFIAGYDSGFGAKPDPGPLFAFAEATGIAPERTLMVGDSTHDLIAGRRAGMVPVAVLTGVAGARELAEFADVVLPDIGHLSQWLSKTT